jgi:hypothetical protein
MGRRKKEWTPADLDMWNEIFKLTASVRKPAIAKGRRSLVRN